MQLTKHHGLGNDFLVLLDTDGSHPLRPEDAVALCARRTGIGADGLLRGTPGQGGADVTMELFNADGSVAEMSGNGIRCLAQAVFQAGFAPPPVLDVATAAGRRTVRVLSTSGASTQQMSVEMGPAKIVGPEPEWTGGDVLQAARVDLGNPHVVLQWRGVELPGTAELVALGERIDGATPGGTNVEVIVADPRSGEIEMVVYERGVGPTRACGTGACAAAAAAHEWGLCEPTATVHMPGGRVEIALGDPVLLTGGVTSVAIIDVPWP